MERDDEVKILIPVTLEYKDRCGGCPYLEEFKIVSGEGKRSKWVYRCSNNYSISIRAITIYPKRPTRCIEELGK